MSFGVDIFIQLCLSINTSTDMWDANEAVVDFFLSFSFYSFNIKISYEYWLAFSIQHYVARKINFKKITIKSAQIEEKADSQNSVQICLIFQPRGIKNVVRFGSFFDLSTQLFCWIDISQLGNNTFPSLTHKHTVLPHHHYSNKLFQRNKYWIPHKEG